MASCDLSIVLDEPDRIFEAEERVTGRVVVDVDKTVRCDGLEVTHLWKTHGRGNVDSGAVGARSRRRGRPSDAVHGTDQRTYEQPLHEEDALNHSREMHALEPGVQHTFEHVFSVPTDAAPTFDSGDDNRVEWLIDTEVDIPNWPDWSAKNALTVMPGEDVQVTEEAAEEPAEEQPDAPGPDKQDGW